jgi:hypothetical protein
VLSGFVLRDGFMGAKLKPKNFTANGKPIRAARFCVESPVAFLPAPGQPERMTKLCTFVGATVGGYAGWFAGDAVGLGFGGAFVLSGIGSMVGVYAGWKLAQKFG